jgi:hypothetical protein
MKLIYLSLGCLLMALVSACSSPSHAADPPSPSAPASTTAPADPYAVPRVITVAYVNSVLKALFSVYGNATRSLVAAHALTPSVEADLRAMYLSPFYEDQIRAAEISLQGAISNVRTPPGNPDVTVERLLATSSTCIFIQTKTDLAAVLKESTPSAASEYYELALKPPSIDPRDLNPTPWAIGFNVAYQTPTRATDPCGKQ